MRHLFAALVITLGVSGCGVVYQSPSVNPLNDTETKVRVQKMTPESVLAANQTPYAPKQLPSAFFTTAGVSSSGVGGGALPRPISDPGSSRTLELRAPPPVATRPYQIGVGDVLLLATPQAGSTVEQLTGLLAASNARQGYSVQDDGAIAIPNVGRVVVAGQTIEEAEAVLFQRLVENQIDPTFSLEVAEFNSQRISIGGSVGNPTVIPVGLKPVLLDEALAAAGGVAASSIEEASVRIFREFDIRRLALQEQRQNFQTRLDLGAEDRDYVYLTGEVAKQTRFPLPFNQIATLADALFENDGVPLRTGNVAEIYVLRGSSDPREFGAVTAWHLDGRAATNFLLATRFEMRPNDIIFVAEQPVTRWSRVVNQITPALINSGVGLATSN